MVALLSFLGLAIDVGYQEYMKTRLQTAADAAAIGAAEELRSGDGGNVVTAAKNDAATNGFTDGKDNVVITVNNPPSTGYSSSDGNAVEVLMQKDVSTFFLPLLGVTTSRVRARSVARVAADTGCVYALSQTASPAFSVSGGVNATINCGVVSNSTANDSLSVMGGSQLNANSVAVGGGYNVSNNSSISPTPVTGVIAGGDPLASVAPPTVPSGCDFSNVSVSGSNTTATLQPGTYCGGIKIQGQSTVTFAAGTYILMGGGLTITGGAIVTGNGVTFYNTGSDTYKYDAISIAGNTTDRLTAPTTGDLAGILFFQDRSIVSTAVNNINGGANITLTGTFYFPTTPLSFSGGASGAYTILIASTVTFTGGTTVNNDYSSLPGGSPLKSTALLTE